MSKSQQAHATGSRREDQTRERSLHILERQLVNTLELTWRVRQVRIRSNHATPTKICLLLDNMASGLESFTEKLRKLLHSSEEQAYAAEVQPSAYWRLFATDSPDLRAQFESLVCGYARYLRQTSEATVDLKHVGDLKSAELLEAIFATTERRLWFLQIYLEALAVNTDVGRLPDWSSC
jgi:DNA-binding ferritin-like protein